MADVLGARQGGAGDSADADQQPRSDDANQPLDKDRPGSDLLAGRPSI